MKRTLNVTFTETVTRSYPFTLELDDEVNVDELDDSDVHELLDQQDAWDQPTSSDWLRSGDIENRDVDDFELVEDAEPLPDASGFKVVELVALVREDDAEEVHATYGKMTEYDQSVSAYIQTRDLTPVEHGDFADVIAEAVDEAWQRPSASTPSS